LTSSDKCGGTRGQALVEFALASVIFFATIFGTIEFGRAVWQYNMVSDLAQEGARWASVHGYYSLSPASSSDVEAYIQARAVGLTVTATASGPPSSLFPGSTVTVVVSSTFVPLPTALFPIWDLSLTSTAEMIMAR
jgi:Flp pilus assembly protein TadG